MKNLVVSLEIAKKLKEAGWEKKTAFYWAFLYDGYSNARIWMLKPELPLSIAHGIPIHPAPTLGELVRELPFGYTLFRFDNESGYLPQERWIVEGSKTGSWEASTPEDAAALAWIALQKEKE